MCRHCAKSIYEELLQVLDSGTKINAFILNKLAEIRSYGQKPACPAMRALEELTPMGSEYREDPRMCSDYISNKLATAQGLVIRSIKNIRDLERNAKTLVCDCKGTIAICGCHSRGKGQMDNNGFWELPCIHGNAFRSVPGTICELHSKGVS